MENEKTPRSLLKGYHSSQPLENDAPQNVIKKFLAASTNEESLNPNQTLSTNLNSEVETPKKDKHSYTNIISTTEEDLQYASKISHASPRSAAVRTRVTLSESNGPPKSLTFPTLHENEQKTTRMLSKLISQDDSKSDKVVFENQKPLRKPKELIETPSIPTYDDYSWFDYFLIFFNYLIFFMIIMTLFLFFRMYISASKVLLDSFITASEEFF
jgi:hypothetical protein